MNAWERLNRIEDAARGSRGTDNVSVGEVLALIGIARWLLSAKVADNDPGARDAITALTHADYVSVARK